MKDKQTPLPLVRKWLKMAPDCYDALDRCRGAKDRGEMQWPDWCELPIAAAYTYLIANLNLQHEQAAMIASELTACWMWRRNKVIYSFDEDLAEELIAQADDYSELDVLPTDLLLRMPYPCIYIDAPMWEDCPGFWAWIEYDEQRPDEPELRIQNMASTMDYSVGAVLHLVPGGTLRDCIDHTVAVNRADDMVQAGEQINPEHIKLQLAAIQFLLYLASAQADVAARPAPMRVDRSNGRGKRARLVQDKVSEINILDVGLRIGAAIRAGKRAQATASSDSIGTGSAKRPHSRRGHWHHYWIGPRDDRSLILRWVAPTFIHAEAGQGDTVVMFPVAPRSDDSK